MSYGPWVNFITVAGELVRMSPGDGVVLEEIWRNEDWELVGFASEMFYDRETRLLMDQEGVGGNLPGDKADEIIHRLKDLCGIAGVVHNFPSVHRYPPASPSGAGVESGGPPSPRVASQGGHRASVASNMYQQQPPPPTTGPPHQIAPQQPVLHRSWGAAAGGTTDLAASRQVEYTSQSGDQIRLIASPHGVVEYLKPPDQREYYFYGTAAYMHYDRDHGTLVDQDGHGALIPADYRGALLWRVRQLCEASQCQHNIDHQLGEVLDEENNDHALRRAEDNLIRSGSPRNRPESPTHGGGGGPGGNANQSQSLPPYDFPAAPAVSHGGESERSGSHSHGHSRPDAASAGPREGHRRPSQRQPQRDPDPPLDVAMSPSPSKEDLQAAMAHGGRVPPWAPQDPNSTGGVTDANAESTRWREYDLPLFPKGETSITTGPRRYFTPDRWEDAKSPDFRTGRGQEPGRAHGGRRRSSATPELDIKRVETQGNLGGRNMSRMATNVSRGHLFAPSGGFNRSETTGISRAQSGWGGHTAFTGSKALIIAPNETAGKAVAKAVKTMHEFLRRSNQHVPIKVLDTERAGSQLLHRSEVLQALDWLTLGTQAGDTVFLGIIGMSYSVAGSPGLPLANNDKFTAYNWQDYFSTLPAGLLVNVIADVTPTTGLFELPYSAIHGVDGAFAVHTTQRYLHKYQPCRASIVALQCNTRSFSPEDTVIGCFTAAACSSMDGKREPPKYTDLLLAIRKAMIGKGVEIRGINREASQSLFPTISSNDEFDVGLARFAPVPWQAGLRDGMDKDIPGLGLYDPHPSGMGLRGVSFMTNPPGRDYPSRRPSHSAYYDLRGGSRLPPQQHARDRSQRADPKRFGMVDPTTESYLGQVSSGSEGYQHRTPEIGATRLSSTSGRGGAGGDGIGGNGLQRQPSKLELFKSRHGIHLETNNPLSPATRGGSRNSHLGGSGADGHGQEMQPPMPTVPIEPRVFDEIRAVLTRVYGRHNPAKIPEIPSLVLEYFGRYQLMFDVIAQRYNDPQVVQEYNPAWGP